MDAQQQQQTQPQDGQKHHKGFRPQIMTFDGKRMRKQIARKYVDFGGTIINSIYVCFELFSFSFSKIPTQKIIATEQKF